MSCTQTVYLIWHLLGNLVVVLFFSNVIPATCFKQVGTEAVKGCTELFQIPPNS